MHLQKLRNRSQVSINSTAKDAENYYWRLTKCQQKKNQGTSHEYLQLHSLYFKIDN
jgi:hypothetical protein